VVALLVNLMGHFVIFQCNQFLLHHQMKDMVKSGTFADNLERIRISNKSNNTCLKFMDENEFYFQNKLYDIVARVTNIDSTTYICIQDKNEQSLINNFTLFLHQHSDFRDNAKAKPILALFQHLLIQALVQPTLSLKQFNEQGFLFPDLISHNVSVYLPHFSPPPERVM
jgi:hypothetical protein